MRVIRQSVFPDVQDYVPDPDRLHGEPQGRCGQCMRQMPSADLIFGPFDFGPNTATELCPKCWRNARTVDEEAAIRASEAALHAYYSIKPLTSRGAKIQQTIPATITSMEDSSGNVVAVNQPMTLWKGTARVLSVNGVQFSASDSFTYPSGITDSVAPSRTGSTLWTLTLVADSGMTAGDYNLTFNSTLTLRNVFRVR